MKLSLFDFDGTITTKDTFVEFIKFYKGTFKFWFGFILLSPLIIAFKIKLIPNWKAKELVLTYFFKNTPIKEFELQCSQFNELIVPYLIRPKALEEIQLHQKENRSIWIVSASPELWIKDWATKHNIQLIGTKLEIRNNLITGKLKDNNCYGPEKAVRIKKAINLDDFNFIEAYGDSSGDKEMLALADESHYKPFR